MPSTSGLGVGNGIAQGANAFVASFMQARRFKHEEKLQQNAFTVQLLTQQLQDENLPYYQRAKILDQIPKLLGVKKMDRQLSEMLGLDKFNEQEVQTGTQRVNSDLPSGGNPQDPNYHQNLMQSVASANPNQVVSNPIMEKQGNLSPAILHNQLRLKQMEVDTAMDIAKQRASYQAQAEILNKGGYTNKVAEGYRGSDYVITMSNGVDTKDIVLKDYTPAIVRKAQIQYAGKGQSGRFAQLAQANEIVRAYEENPSPELEPQYKAAKGLLDDFERNGVLKQEQIKSLQLGNSGQKPATITATKTDEDRDRTARIQVQKDYDEATGELQGIESEISTYNSGGTNDKSAAATESSKAENERIRLLNEVGANDQEYKNAAKVAKEKLQRYQTLETKYTELQRKKTQIANKVSAAQKRLGMVGSSGSSGMEGLSPVAQAYVNKYFGGDVTKAKAAYFAKFGKPLQ